MSKKPASEGLEEISVRIASINVDKDKKLNMVEKEAGRLKIATKETIEKTGYIEIPVYDNVKEKEEAEK